MALRSLLQSALVFLYLPPLFSALEFCGPPFVLPGGTNSCPPSSSGLKTVDGRVVCCGYASPVDGHNPEGKPLAAGKKPGGKYCGPYLTVDNIPRCPATHLYDASKSGKNRCCGDKPIGNQQKDQGKRTAAGNATCVDLAAPGRPSDCPANKHHCEDPLWRDLMTEQCPRTCGRCGQKAQLLADGRRGGAIAGVCRDGVGPNGGESECPANKDRCRDPVWKAFMERECPRTCGICGGSATRRHRRTTTSSWSTAPSTSTTRPWG